MPGDEFRDGSEGEEQEDGEQRDGSVAEHACHSKRDLERVKKALMKLHVNLGHPGVKELIRVLKHGRASELAIQEARRMRCDVCAENVQSKLPRPAVPRQVLDFNERFALDVLSLPHWKGFTKSVKCLNIVCHGTLFQMIIPLWSGTTALDLRQAYREGWQRWARDPKQVVIDPAGENLHDIFLERRELNSVETEITAAESLWQAGIIEANDRAFKMVFKKMLESTQPKDKREFEECIDATVSATNVLLRTHGFTPYQHVFGRELAFDVLVPGADVAPVTLPVLDRPSERATQIRQAARQAFVECQGDKAMRRALVARPRPWREFQVGDQVAFWRKGKGRGMKHGHARWHGRAVILALCLGSKNVWVAYRHQLLKVSQEQLRIATITERVADDVIHQELRAMGENSAAEGQVLPKYLDISKDPPPPSAEEFTLRQVRKREQNDMNDSKVAVRDMFNKKALHRLTIQMASPLLMELCRTRKDQKWRRARRHDEELQGRESC